VGESSSELTTFYPLYRETIFWNLTDKEILLGFKAYRKICVEPWKDFYSFEKSVAASAWFVFFSSALLRPLPSHLFFQAKFNRNLSPEFQDYSEGHAEQRQQRNFSRFSFASRKSGFQLRNFRDCGFGTAFRGSLL
jgi:hypothetical protein